MPLKNRENNLMEIFTKKFHQAIQQPANHPFYEIKKQAFDAFRHFGLPTHKNEAYKYTPLHKHLPKIFDFGQPTTTPQLTDKTIQQYLFNHIEAYHLVLINGKFSARHSVMPTSHQAVTVLNFQEAYAQHASALLAHLAQYAHDKSDALTALNTALFEDGLLIQIADHTVMQKPLIIYHMVDAQMPHTMVYPRLLMVAGSHSQASVATANITIGTHASFSNAVTEIVLQEQAQVDHYILQTQVGHGIQIDHTQCQQAKGSLLNMHTLTLDGALVRNNLNIVLNGQHAATNLYGLYLLQQQQHIDNQTIVNHQSAYTNSQELYKGILGGKSTGVFNGKIYVQPNAQKIQAYQTNNNLLLTDQAKMRAKPQLEIWANDVTCSHGATTGQLDEAQLFYLRARGIAETTARHMLLQAFAQEVIKKIPFKGIKTYLEAILAKKIQILFNAV